MTTTSFSAKIQSRKNLGGNQFATKSPLSVQVGWFRKFQLLFLNEILFSTHAKRKTIQQRKLHTITPYNNWAARLVEPGATWRHFFHLHSTQTHK